jgi:hypothetical protein
VSLQPDQLLWQISLHLRQHRHGPNGLYPTIPLPPPALASGPVLILSL